MVIQKRNIRGTNEIKYCISRHVQLNGCEPILTLTQAGARRLLEWLKIQGLEGSTCVPEVNLRGFFKGNGFPTELISALDAPSMSTLLCSASEGFGPEGININPRALNALAQTKEIKR